MSTLVGVGVSEKKDPYLAASEAAKLALYQIHHKEISLGFLFSSIQFADQRLLDGIAYSLGHIKLLGCSGASLITTSGSRKYGVGLMLISSDRLKFGMGIGRDISRQGPRVAGEEFGHQALKNLGHEERHFALTISDGLIENGSELMLGVKDVLGTSFPLYGASSADNFRFHRTCQYTNDTLLTDSIIGAVFAGDKPFGIGIRHGWKPLGKPHVITKVKGNVIKEIEGKPAVRIYEEYFNKSLEDIRSSLIRISSFYPLGLYVTGETEYLLRNALRIDEDGGLVCQCDAQEGQDVRLMMGTKEWALAAATEAAKEAKANLEDRPVKGVLIFESFSRHRLLGRLTENELSRIKEVMGDVPILGVCTYGEQAPLKSLEHHGQTYVHSETIMIVAIGEPHAPHRA
jgi:hypothetical protein